MRCPDCKGQIEGPRPFCPHCGRKFDGLLSSFASSLGKTEPKRQAQLAELHRRAVENPMALRLAVGAVGGAVTAGFIPGVNWFIGGLVGLFIAFRTMRKNG